jgi:hypothetical protein
MVPNKGLLARSSHHAWPEGSGKNGRAIFERMEEFETVENRQTVWKIDRLAQCSAVRKISISSSSPVSMRANQDSQSFRVVERWYEIVRLSFI